VVRPDDKADAADRDHRVGHAEIAETPAFFEKVETICETMPKAGRIMM